METSIQEITNVLEFEAEQTVMIGTSEATKSIQIQSLCKHARTMLMMFSATGDQKYVKQAKSDLDLARTIKVGFMRPLGALPNEAA